jgi:hemerythrin superfamily protein
MDVISLLQDDHNVVKELFQRFEPGMKGREKILEKIISELTVHTAVEEQLVYPAIRERVPDLEREAWRAVEEHHAVKLLMAELAEQDRDDLEPERLDAKVEVLIESTLRHIDEEESLLLPRLREVMNPDELELLGAHVEEAKTHVPKRAPQLFELLPSALLKEQLPRTARSGRKAVSRQAAVGKSTRRGKSKGGKSRSRPASRRRTRK